MYLALSNLKNIISCLEFVLDKESGISFDQLRAQSSFINYPQWLATVNKFGWDNSLKFGPEDRAALFPLNITLLRMHGVMKNRRKYFQRAQEDAMIVRNRLSLPSAIDLQLSVFISSNIHVNWNKLDKKGKDERYSLLWVNFKGKLWIDLQRIKDDS